MADRTQMATEHGKTGDCVPDDVAELIDLLFAEALRQGCTCNAEIVVPRLAPGETGEAVVFHAQLCAIRGQLNDV